MIDSAKSKQSGESIDVGAQRVAAIYAKALLGAAEAKGKADELASEFDAFVGALDDFPQLAAVLASPRVSHEEKSQILDRVFGKRLSPLLLDGLKVISRHGRLDIARAIGHEVSKAHDELRGRVRVKLQSAVPLGDALKHKLTDTLKQILGGQPQLEAQVDPELIGGMVLRVGDTVFDGSVASQLNQIREQMITRSVHEIQSRRDRFRHSGGN